MPAYIEFDCPCGRTLRVKPEQAGTVVRCWSCHEERLVPRPKVTAKLARETVREAQRVFEAETFLWICVWAVAMVVTLVVPWVGLLLVLIPLAIGGMGVRAAMLRERLRGQSAEPGASIRRGRPRVGT